MLYYVLKNIIELNQDAASVTWVGRGAQRVQCRSRLGAVAKELRKFCV